ncbi:MAG: lolB [Nevskia sp.]|nr:lolB [Nevskia sp.]
MSHRALRVLLGASALCLAACATTTAPPAAIDQQQAGPLWQNHQASLLAIARFNLQGRIAEHGLSGNRADLQWTQRAAHFEVRVSGPLGVGALLLSGEPNAVSIRTKDGVLQTADPSAFMRQQLGWSLPVPQLRYWVLGLPAPGSTPSLILDAHGRAAALKQDGWSVEYTEYQTVDPLELPRKIELADGTHSFRLVIDQWSGIGASAAGA